MDPRTEYEGRLEQRRAASRGLVRRERLLANGRLLAFAIGVATLVLGFVYQWLSPWWALVPAVAYVALAIVHDRSIRSRERMDSAVAFYERGLARFLGTWPGKGVTRTDLVPEDHPCAVDVDLFGEGSLFDLVCLARTQAGETTLARWLAHPADREAILARQEAVREIRPRLDLREDVATLGGGVRSGTDPDLLTSWSTAPAAFGRLGTAGAWIVAWCLAAASLATLGAWIWLGAGPLPFVASLAASAVIQRLLRGATRQVISAVERPGRELVVLSTVLSRLESEQYASPLLAGLSGRLRADGLPASRAIRSLTRLVGWLDARRNALFAPIAFMLAWNLQFACLLERWRARHGVRIPEWLRVVGEMEALLSLAGHAWENPRDVHPEIVEGEPVFDARELGHPLLPDAGCVRNDVRLDGETRALVVSGSNMSGKSTLLRTIGVAAVLANAGGTVRARSLRVSRLRVGATVRIQDSLLGGASRFYTEVRRLKLIRDLADGDVPLLFLLDEVFHGTNSSDRQQGAAALVVSFLGAGAIGLVVTHDLAIAEAAESIPGVANVHFTDRVVDGKLVFDYRLREGIVEGSNAIEIMRSEGLDV